MPDAAAPPAESDCDPEQYTLLCESIRLAFVAALQYLLPRQRPVLLQTVVARALYAEHLALVERHQRAPSARTQS